MPNYRSCNLNLSKKKKQAINRWTILLVFTGIDRQQNFQTGRSIRGPREKRSVKERVGL